LHIRVADLLIQDAGRVRVHRKFTRLVRSATQRRPEFGHNAGHGSLQLVQELAVGRRGIYRVVRECLDLVLDIDEGRCGPQGAVDHVELLAIRMRVDGNVGEVEQLLRPQYTVVQLRRVTHALHREQRRLHDGDLSGDGYVDIEVAAFVGGGLDHRVDSLHQGEGELAGGT